MHLFRISAHESFMLSQGFGVAAIVFNIMKFTRNGRKSILLWGFPVSVSFFLSQSLNNQYQGAAVSAVGLFSALMQAFMGAPEKRTHRMAIALIAISTALCIEPPTFYWATILPFVIFLLARSGEAFRSELVMRSVWLVGTTLYFIYFTCYSNYALMVSEAIVFAISVYKIREICRMQALPAASSV